MTRSRLQAIVVKAAVGTLAAIVAGCGSGAGLVAGPSPTFSAGEIGIVPEGAIVGTALTLESRHVTDPSGSTLYYSWDFGDGTTGLGEAATHVYASGGQYLATLTVQSAEAGTAQTTMLISVGSLTGGWSGDYGSLSITQDGFDLRGTYQDGPQRGEVVGTISQTGTVTFTMTNPAQAPVTFTGTAGREVMTLVGAANGRDAVNRPLTLTRR